MSFSSGSSSTSRILAVRMKNILQRLKYSQNRDSTAKNYLCIWRKFNEFLIKLDKSPDSWEERVSLYGAYMVDFGYQSSTLKLYFSAIKHVLKVDGYNWDDRKIWLNTLVKACHLQNDRVLTRLPIGCKLWELILFELERKFHNQPYLEGLYKAMFCLGYYGLMRVGELTRSAHTLLAKDIHIAQNRQKIQVLLRSSKTHSKWAKPQEITISESEPPHSFKKNFCPFKVIREYLCMRGGYITDDEAFFIYSDRSSIWLDQMRVVLRTCLSNMGLNSHLYDCHSLRIRRGSDLLYKFKFSIEKIKI